MPGLRTRLRARLQTGRQRAERVSRAIREEDLQIAERAVALSRTHRILAPLAFAVGAITMLFEGVRVLFSNWRLTLVQILPAMWIWLAMFDLKLHVLHGKSFHSLKGPILLPIWLAIVALTAASFFLNAVFAFAIAASRPPEVRRGLLGARANLRAILLSGGVVGVLLALASTLGAREGKPWFALSMGVVVGLMMVCYVAVPSRLIGVRTTGSRRDKLTASAIGTAMSTTVVTPPYLLGRLGILMLGSRLLLIPGIILLAVGLTLQAGATGAVRAVRLSAILLAGDSPAEPLAPDSGETPEAIGAMPEPHEGSP